VSVFVRGRQKSWGFPRWEGYDKGRDAATLRMCEFPGCTEVGEHPAPKHRDSEEKWWFCQVHAAEFNKNWNYFTGMTDQEKEEAANDARYHASRNRAWDWSSDDDGSDHNWTSQERAALSVLGLHPTAMPDEIKAQYRQLAKQNHPDANLGDPESEERFKQIQAAYETLRIAIGE
jgi:hypothetical protein